MERECAKKIAAGLDRLADELNALGLAVEEIAEESERKIFRRLIARLMAGEYADMCRAIGRRFPDLDPLARRLNS